MTFKINDLFYTIQGEGLNAGRPALFIRLPHCNLSCPWCDTDFEGHTDYQVDDLKAIFKNNIPSKFAVLTGGEPSMNKQTRALVGLLKDFNFWVAMESNGQFLADPEVDHLTISPKRWSAKTGQPSKHSPFWFNTENRPSEIKLVVDADDVFLVADDIFERYESDFLKFKNDNANFYLSPEWNQRDQMIPKIVEYVKENPQWKINLQTHKFLGVK